MLILNIYHKSPQHSDCLYLYELNYLNCKWWICLCFSYSFLISINPQKIYFRKMVFIKHYTPHTWYITSFYLFGLSVVFLPYRTSKRLNCLGQIFLLNFTWLLRWDMAGQTLKLFLSKDLNILENIKICEFFSLIDKRRKCKRQHLKESLSWNNKINNNKIFINSSFK